MKSCMHDPVYFLGYHLSKIYMRENDSTARGYPAPLGDHDARALMLAAPPDASALKASRASVCAGPGRVCHQVLIKVAHMNGLNTSCDRMYR